MAVAIGRKADHVRVLQDVSGLVVRALLDEDDEARSRDPFEDALRRYAEEGAPQDAAWRRAVPRADPHTGRTVEILRHLTRDLLKGVTMPPREPEPAAEAAEPAPANVHPISEARDVPALELASDGTWKPSGSTISSQEEVDAAALRRSVPSLGSRYPHVARAEHVVLPPAPAAARFTNVTPAPVAPIEPEPLAGPAPAEAAPVRAAPLVDRESVIRAVAGGTELVAGPFARFQQLALFVKALRALPGVQDVTTRQFVRGMVHLRIRHSHAVPLADLVRELVQFSPTVVSSTPDRIEITVQPPDDVPPAGA